MAGIAIVTSCSRKFLPGVYALWNSAVACEWNSTLRVFLDEDGQSFAWPAKDDRVHVERAQRDGSEHRFVHRWKLLQQLPPGNYLYLDADVVVERPLPWLHEAIEEGLLVSTEPWRRVDPDDLWVLRQCRALGVEFPLPDYPYVNAGLLGFQLPRDTEFLVRLHELSAQVSVGVSRMLENELFPFLDQDVLNLLIRERTLHGGKMVSLSSSRVELSAGDGVLTDRPFPWQRQRGLQPADKFKYLIHGASCRRPWLLEQKTGSGSPAIKASLERFGIAPLRRRCLGKLTPYERAWAHYACADTPAVRLEAWARDHEFDGFRHALWRGAYGLGR